MAMACLRLFTFPPLPPLPERSVPCFLRRIALSTVFPAALPYRRPRDLFPELFLAGMVPSCSFRSRTLFSGCAKSGVGTLRQRVRVSIRETDHQATKYFAAGWCTTIAEVLCSGSSRNPEVRRTPTFSSGLSRANSLVWSSRFGHAG
jgi:hypothetical protein